MSAGDERNLQRIVAFADDLARLIDERCIMPEAVQADQVREVLRGEFGA